MRTVLTGHEERETGFAVNNCVLIGTRQSCLLSVSGFEAFFAFFSLGFPSKFGILDAKARCRRAGVSRTRRLQRTRDIECRTCAGTDGGPGRRVTSVTRTQTRVGGPDPCDKSQFFSLVVFCASFEVFLESPLIPLVVIDAQQVEEGLMVPDIERSHYEENVALL